MSDLLAVPGTGVIIDKAHNNYILNVQDPETYDRINRNIPYLFSQPYDSGHLIVLPVHEDSIRMLYNIKLPTQGLEPLHWSYQKPLIEGEFKAMVHQVASAAFMSVHNRCFNTSTMRTGKTGTVVMCTDYLQSVKQVSGSVLIVATVSNLTGVWLHTINKTLPHKRAIVVHGGVGKLDRVRRLQQYADYYIINYDGVKLVEQELKQMVEQQRISIIVLDELTHYGNPRSQRYTAMYNIANGKHRASYVYGLTGSPGDNPIPIFGFVKMVNEDKLPVRRITAWRELTMYKYGREAWQWRNRHNCAEIIYNTMQPNIRFDKKDIMDLPPIVKQKRTCSLSKEQESAYKKMREEMVAICKNGKLIEAVHKSSLSQKLFQIALGTAIGADKKSLIDLDNGPRIELLEELIKEAEQKVVLFCAYTGAIDRYAEQLRKKGYTVEIVDGRVTGKKRDIIFNNFQNKENPRIIICHPRTTAFGVELAAADTMIFNGPPLNGDFIYEQALERLSSLKQKAKQISIIQVAATQEESDFFRGLDAGVKSSELVNNMFAAMTKNLKKDLTS